MFNQIHMYDDKKDFTSVVIDNKSYPDTDHNNPIVFMDIKIGDDEPKKIEMELYADRAPKTAENFFKLCTGQEGISKVSKKPLHYKNNVFHRVIKDFMAQGGDFTKENGTGGESIFGEKFDDEYLKGKHKKRG